jgi:lysophospholipase L1-like esterase
VIGLLMIASGLLINPWVGALWKGVRLEDYRDVLTGYFFWSLALGAITVALGRLVTRSRRFDGLTLLTLVLSGVILSDRLLLVRHGLDVWESDPVLGHRNRPGVVRTWHAVGRPHDHLRINRYGHHDDDFDLQKAPGEFRGLMLGDSVTLGWGVPYEETFSAHLEDLLAERDERFTGHQIINAGVSGYSTLEELEVLRRSMVFEPDFIAVGFCMNDLVMPFVVDTRYGGVGSHRWVTEAGGPIADYLINETGFGQTIQRLRARRTTRERAKREEIFNVRAVASQRRDSETYRPAWDLVLSSLEGIYDLAAEADVPVVLLIFPFDFQLLRPELREPQRILIEHAAAHGVVAIDFTEIFRDLIYDDPDRMAALERDGRSPGEIKELLQPKIDEYFLDADHFTDRGHRVVAAALIEHLIESGTVGPPAPRTD